MIPFNKEEVLRDLEGYKNSMTEFDSNQMQYLINLVSLDILKDTI